MAQTQCPCVPEPAHFTNAAHHRDGARMRYSRCLLIVPLVVLGFVIVLAVVGGGVILSPRHGSTSSASI